MAGIQLTEQRRSQLLEQLLAQQEQRPQIRSGIGLAARLGAQLIRQKKINKLNEQEVKSQEKLLKALRTGKATDPQSITLEDFEGGSGRQQVGIPGKRADPGASAQAISELPIQLQINV